MDSEKVELLNNHDKNDLEDQTSTITTSNTKDTSPKKYLIFSINYNQFFFIISFSLLLYFITLIPTKSTWNHCFNKFKSTHHHHKSQIKWKACIDHPEFQCTKLKVPKNYFNSSSGFSTIAISKYSTSHKLNKPLIFINPGGPGGSGYDFNFRFGKNLSNLVKGQYDILGFDPRGIGLSTPIVSCFPSTLDYELFKSGTILERGFDIPKDPFSIEGKLHLLDQNRQLLALQQVEFKKCEESMGEELNYMGTATNVRDIEEMSRVLRGPEAKINYYGASYGTVLGAFLVNMIPSKIGRVIIDGVASSPQWANQQTYTWLKNWMVDTESAYEWFLRDCHNAGPNNCDLARSTDENFSSINLRLMNFLNELYDSPLPVPNGNRPGILTSGSARSLLYVSTNRPGSWSNVAKFFNKAIVEKNATELYNTLIKPFHLNDKSKIQIDLSRVAVSCLDSPKFESEQDSPTAEFLVENTLDILNSTSRNFGASVSLIEPDGGCQFWSASGKEPERFTGPWNATLNTPMLIISNTADPITPKASGIEIDTLMKNSSRLLLQNSPGHCSLSSTSICTTKIIRNYFLNGILPHLDTVCEIDQGFFPTDDNLKLEEEKVWKVEGSEEEKELFEISSALSKGWNDWMSEI